MSLQLILMGLGGVGLLIGYAIWRLKQAHHTIERLTKQTEALQQQTALAEQQVKQYETRKNIEKNHRSFDRNNLIERLRQQGDLRD